MYKLSYSIFQKLWGMGCAEPKNSIQSIWVVLCWERVESTTSSDSPPPVQSRREFPAKKELSKLWIKIFYDKLKFINAKTKWLVTINKRL